jgi:hypothetical protein
VTPFAVTRAAVNIHPDSHHWSNSWRDLSRDQHVAYSVDRSSMSAGPPQDMTMSILEPRLGPPAMRAEARVRALRREVVGEHFGIVQ